MAAKNLHCGNSALRRFLQVIFAPHQVFLPLPIRALISGMQFAPMG
jgi:hypothetical protein